MTACSSLSSSWCSLLRRHIRPPVGAKWR
jgi:hypothetical protein